MSEQRISRRKFMQTTACVAGATLAGRSFLLDPRPSYASPRAVPAGDTVRMGIIGVGMQGSGLLRTSIQLPGVECVAACDLYDGRRELAKEIVDKEIPTTRHNKELLDNRRSTASLPRCRTTGTSKSLWTVVMPERTSTARNL